MVFSHFRRQSFAVACGPEFTDKYPRVVSVILHCLPWARRVNEGTKMLNLNVEVAVVVVAIAVLAEFLTKVNVLGAT